MIEKITPEDLAKHLAWLRGEEGGEQLSVIWGACLHGADLHGANLRDADLYGADLRDADLRDADLYGANLYCANLRDADLYGANLRDADLYGANLRGANLRDADLRDANLYGALNIPDYVSAVTNIVPEGDIIGYKKLRGRKIAKLRIPSDAKRCNATGRKCRAEFAEVLSIESIDGKKNFEEGFSYRKENPLCYKIGEIVRPDSFDEDRWNECSHGIHFFLTRYEAEVYE